MLSIVCFSALLVLAHGATDVSQQPIRNESAILKIDFVNDYFNVLHFVSELRTYTNSNIDFIPDDENKPNIYYIKVNNNGPNVPRRIFPAEFLPEGLPLQMYVVMNISHCTVETCKFTEISDLVNFLNSEQALKTFKVRSMKVTIVKSDRPLWLIFIVIVVAFVLMIAVPAGCLRLCAYLKAKRKAKSNYKLTTTLPKPIEVEMKLIKVISGKPSTGSEEV
uniref:Interferon gamma receptor 2 n=1 Tax=Panagrellus redivivus TaxID=6233 RepID=A0A7E4V088_PANRE